MKCEVTAILSFILLCVGSVGAQDYLTEPFGADASVAKPLADVAQIDAISAQTLYLTATKEDTILFSATGFVVERTGANYLITNWHVLAGRNPMTGQPLHPSGATPTDVHIWHSGHKLGTWVRRKEPLYNKRGEKRWLEHRLKAKVDVVALPLLSIDKEVKLQPFDLSLANSDMRAYVGITVSIVGFPLGFAGPGLFPIWKTGHIASEPELDYNGDPMFLIDATTCEGMSGAPVVLRLAGGYMSKSGGQIVTPGITTRFLGVYSGRLSKDSEIGRVWRPRLISEILHQ